MSDGVLRMADERRALVDSLATHCYRCKVPYGEHGCTHAAPTAEKLLASVFQIAAEEEHKQRVRNAQHALRYRAQASADEQHDPTVGMPPDLVRALKDPTIILQRDHEVRLADGRPLHEHLEEWRNAPSNTMSALPHDVPAEEQADE